MSESDSPVVLIVEDEPAVAEGYELWLEGEYETKRAADGAEALEVVDETVDVVMLDRMMPELSGEQVLAKVRERELDVRVVMVSAVEPDFDVIEMGFDAYITKPPDREELLETIDGLIHRAELDDDLQEYYSLMERKSTLEAQKTEAELAESAEYAELQERIDSARAEADDALGDVGDDQGFVGASRELFGEPESENATLAEDVIDETEAMGGEDEEN